jgi:predicted  nucleic acid-binding Zn-ribbon protein
MSEDRTQDMSEKYDTKPTIETVIEMLQEFRASVESRLDSIERKLAQIDIRFDRLEADSHKTRSEMLAMRADFNEFRLHFKEPA